MTSKVKISSLPDFDMTQIAQAAGIGRESLYKALRADAQPRFQTIQRV